MKRTMSSQGFLSETHLDVYVTHPSPLLPKHQRRGCHTRYSENAPSWCWRGHPEYPGETGQNNGEPIRKECRWPRNPLLRIAHRAREHTSTMHHGQGVQVHMNQDSEHPICPPTAAQWMNKGWHFHTAEINKLTVIKVGQLLTSTHSDEETSPEHCVQWDKSDTKSNTNTYILYYTIFMKFKNRQKPANGDRSQLSSLLIEKGIRVPTAMLKCSASSSR